MEFIDKIAIGALKKTKLFPKYVEHLEAETPLLAEKLANLGKWLTGVSASLVGLESMIVIFPPNVHLITQYILGAIAASGLILTAIFKAQTK